MADPNPTVPDPDALPSEVSSDAPVAPPLDAPAAPAKRGGRWWIWLILGLLVVGLGVGGYFAYQYSLQQEAKRNAVQTAMETEKHWAAAAAKLEAIKLIGEDLPDIASASASSSVKGWVSSLDAMKTTAGPELAEARKSAESMPEGPARAAYLSAILDGEMALKKALGARSALEKLPFFYQKTQALEDAITQARTNINTGVDAGNKEKDATSAKESRRALASLALADRLVAEMRKAIASDNSLGDAGLDDATKLIKYERSLANLSLQIAVAGAAGNINKANAAIDRYNKMTDQGDQYPDPDFFGDPSRFGNTPIADLRNAAELLEAAKRYHETALRESMNLQK